MYARRLLTTVLALATAAVPLTAAPASAAPPRATLAAGSATTSGTAKKSPTAKSPARSAKRPATTRTTRPKTVASVPGRRVRTAKVVYLTFDDGPTAAYTPQVLQILARYEAKGTFFVIGQQAAARPDLVRRIRASGHAVGNHTWDHPNLTTLPTAQVATQLTRTNAALGRRVRCVRPPYGAMNANVGAIARRAGLTPVLWNVDSQDWMRPGAATITTNALAAPAGGGAPVVLFHDGGGPRTQTLAALPSVIEAYARRGYRFESLPACR